MSSEMSHREVSVLESCGIDPTLPPLDVGPEFDLLGYLDDSSLIATLGIENATEYVDDRSKIQEPNAKHYADLLPPPLQQNYTSSMDAQNETPYAVYDTEPQLTTLESPTLSDISSSVFLTPTSQNKEQITYETVQIIDNSVEFGLVDNAIIVVNPNPIEDNLVSSVEVQETNLPETLINQQVNHLQLPEGVGLSSSPTTLSPLPSLPLKSRKGKTSTRSPYQRTRKQQGVEEEGTLGGGGSDKQPPKTKTPSRRRPRKEKKYEIEQSLEDPVLEKKRLNAINAKKNRDKKKGLLQNLADQVAVITEERNQLLLEVQELKKKEQNLREKLAQKCRVPLI